MDEIGVTPKPHQLRLECLRLAHVGRATSPAEDIVREAEKLMAFVVGGVAKESPAEQGEVKP